MSIDEAQLALINSAKDKANKHNLATQSVLLWSSLQRDILATARDIQGILADGRQPAVAADYCKRQGAALAALLQRFNSNQDKANPALLSVFGITAEEVAASVGLLQSIITALASADDQGADASALAQMILDTLTEPEGVL